MATTVDERPLARAASVRGTPRARVILAGIVVVIVLAEVATRLIASHLPPPLTWHSYETQRKVQEMDALAKRGGADVVFLGTSMVNVGFEPDAVAAQLGGHTTVYNAALSSAVPRMTELWFRDVVMPRLHPKVIVLGVATFDFTDCCPPARTVFLNAFANSAEGRHELGRDNVVQSADLWLDHHSSLWAHRFQLRDPKTFARGVTGGTPVKDQEAAGLQPDGRQSLGQDEGFRDLLQKDIAATASHWSLGVKDPAAIDQLVADARSHGTKVVLVEVPVTNEYVNRHPHGEADYQTLGVAARALADRDGATLVDFDSIRDHSLFADEIHLNKTGAKLVSTRLGQALLAEHVLGQ